MSSKCGFLPTPLSTPVINSAKPLLVCLPTFSERERKVQKRGMGRGEGGGGEREGGGGKGEGGRERGVLKKGKERKRSPISLRLSFPSKRLWFVDTVFVSLSLTINETLKWFSSLPILMLESFWW